MRTQINEIEARVAERREDLDLMLAQ